MTPDALRKLNQFRTFAGGWEALRTGDELDVPVAPLPPVVWEGESKDKPGSTGAADSQDAGAHRVAGLASQAGGFLSSSARGEAAASMARGMATGAVGGEVQQWLSQFGTARVQLDADKNFSLKQSQLDLLVPLHEKKDRLVFAQGSVHRTDERTQTNLGVGYRWFNDGWMLGGNTFLDHDLSRSHTRMGVGLEYWRDFLKLGANSYHRLSSWKDSPDLTDYEERPANGWDLRAQAWVPALPQLGGKLTFEQYYGDQVGLFGKDARQSNPHAITAGVNYTPIPLLTFNAEHRQGQAGKSDARLGVEMRYQLGVPWQHQVDPAAVAAMRSLAGSRHDLVERNNNIVLEYRKKEVIRLRTAELVTGHAGERKSLGVVVNSKYGLERIDWSAPTLLAAGGKIVNDGPQGYGVVLPPYRTAAGSVNSYTVSGVAVDTKGNASNRSETQVTVLAPVISESLSSFLPASSVLLADGKGTRVLTLTLKDGQGQAVDVAASEIAVGAGGATRLPAGATISAPKQSADGTYEVTVTAGTRGEVLTLTPVVSGVTLAAARVNINDMTPAAAQSSFTAAPATLAADNQASTTLTLTLKNAAGDVLSGLASQLSLVMKDGGGTTRAAEAVTLGTLTESGEKGVYTATFKGAVAGTYTLVPEYNGSVLGDLSASVTLTAGVAVQATSHIVVDKASYASGGDIGLTVVLKDAQGNPVAGQEGGLSSAVTAEHAALRGAWSGNAAGEYTATYTAREAGTDLKASLLLSGWRSAQTAVYAITAGTVATDTSTIHTDKAGYASGESMTVTVVLKDAAGNPVAGQAALLATAVSVAHADLSGSWSDKGEGSYGATYTAKTAGTNLQATLTLNGASATPATYSINAGAVAAGNSAIAIDRQAYISGSDMTVTVSLKDAAGNPVSGQAGSLGDKVAVPNAIMKPGADWTETPAGSGIYIARYVAGAVSTHQTATLRLGGETRPSGTYAITAGTVTTATLAADKATYVAGSSLILTVTLKDAQGNPAPGQAGTLTAETVKAANAELKGSWAETGTAGTYSATYTAKTAGTGLKANLKLGSVTAA
ncbi:invasin, partial [Serratia odorifera]